MDEDLPSLVLGVEEVSCADASFQQNNSNEYFHDVGIERDDNAMSFSRWQRISETVWNKIDPNYHIRSHLSEVTKPDLPLLTISALTFVWISYIYGIVYLTAMQSAQGSVWLVESPPQETLVFRTVAQWPQCVDARAQVWRLLSFQLVHNGIMHILGNTLLGLSFGTLLENMHTFGPGFSCASYLGGVVGGAMGFAYVWPYGSLVGCSCGIYGMMGATIGLLIVNRDDKRNYKLKTVFITIVITITLLIEFILYFASYDPTVGYASHICGIIFGALLGLSVGVWKYGCRWKQVTGCVSILVLVGYVGLVVGFYSRPWPPTAPGWNPTFQPDYNPLNTCCARLIGLQSALPGVPVQVLRDSFACI